MWRQPRRQPWRAAAQPNSTSDAPPRLRCSGPLVTHGCRWRHAQTANPTRAWHMPPCPTHLHPAPTPTHPTHVLLLIRFPKSNQSLTVTRPSPACTCNPFRCPACFQPTGRAACRRAPGPPFCPFPVHRPAPWLRVVRPQRPLSDLRTWRAKSPAPCFQNRKIPRSPPANPHAPHLIPRSAPYRNNNAHCIANQLSYSHIVVRRPL